MASILDCVVSRWGDNGVVMEADFSQLEIVGVAWLSQDAALINDIQEGRDLHCVSASFLSGESYDLIYDAVQNEDKYWTTMRKAAKGPSFQLQYGAGVKSIAESCGLTEQQAKQFVEGYYSRYPGIKEWQEGNIQHVQDTAKYRGHRVRGRAVRTASIISATGREYVFHENESPEFMKDKGVMFSFNPPNIKNYPSQGFATGDLVPLALGELVKELKQDSVLKDTALLINTVHDSVILDVHVDVVEQAGTKVQQVLQRTPDYLKQYFGLYFDLPLNADVKYGGTWSEAK